MKQAIKNFVYQLLWSKGQLSHKRFIAVVGAMVLYGISVYATVTNKAIDHHIFDGLILVILTAAGISAGEKIAELRKGPASVSVTNMVSPAAAVVALLALCLAMTGCGVAGKVTTKVSGHVAVSVAIDSMAGKTNTRQKDSAVYTSKMTDTAIGVTGHEVTLEVPKGSDLDTAVKQGNVTLHTYTAPDGTRRISCKADSLTLVIRNLIRENAYMVHSIDSLNDTWAMKVKSDSTDNRTLETVVKQENKGFLARIKQLLSNLIEVFVIILIWEGIGFIIKKIARG